MSSVRAIAVWLLLGSAFCADAATAGTLPGTICSIEEVEKKIKGLGGKEDKAGVRSVMRECNWAVDASSCTFRDVVEMFREQKTSKEVRAKCMR